MAGASSLVPARPVIGTRVDATSCQLLGVAGATGVYGPDLTPMLCERVAAVGVPVGFYGSAPEVLEDLTTNLVRGYPALRVAYSHSPPFRLLTPDEDERVAESSNPRFVALYVRRLTGRRRADGPAHRLGMP